jgi:hypothetical protein
MTKKLSAIFVILMLCGCTAAKPAETLPETVTMSEAATTAAAVTAAATEFIPKFTPAPIIAEDISEDGALKLTVKMHGTEFVTFEKITADVTLENLTDEDYNFVFGGGDVVDNKPPIYCGFWTEAMYETLAFPRLSYNITFTPGQILKKTVEFTPNYKEMGDYIFFADMPYSKDGVNYFLSIEPIKLTVGFRYTHETTIENSTALERAINAEDRAKNVGEPDQDYKSLPYADDFSDKDFSYRYLGTDGWALWMVKDGSLIVYNDTPNKNSAAVIGNYSWSYYSASIDFNLRGSGVVTIRYYKQISGDFDDEEYGFTVDSLGNWYAGDSRGIRDHERGEILNYGTIVTGKFANFDPGAWNTIEMISKDGKFYISLNSGEDIYICDLDPNSAGAIMLSASTGTEFDNLEIADGEYNL